MHARDTQVPPAFALIVFGFPSIVLELSSHDREMRNVSNFPVVRATLIEA
jgi:hypothetical protein